MGKPTVDAKEVLGDIQAGLSNAALKEKYKLSDSGLRSLFNKLVKAGLLSWTDLDARLPPPTSKPALEPQPREGIPARRCPGCNEVVDIEAVDCIHCGARLDDLSRTEDEDSAWQEGYCPWEDAGTLGWLEAIKQTAVGVLFSPAEFFSKIPRKVGYAAPMVFGVLMTSMGLAALGLWSMIFGTIGISFLWFLVLAVFLGPLASLLTIGMSSLLYHLSLSLVGAAGDDMEPTVRVVCYASSAHVWLVVPILGPLISGVWFAAATVIGFREIHETTLEKALLAVLLPILVCIVVPGWLFVMVKVL